MYDHRNTMLDLGNSFCYAGQQEQQVRIFNSKTYDITFKSRVHDSNLCSLCSAFLWNGIAPFTATYLFEWQRKNSRCCKGLTAKTCCNNLVLVLVHGRVTVKFQFIMKGLDTLNGEASQPYHKVPK